MSMAGYGLRSKKFLAGLVLAVLLGGAGVAWMERANLLAWGCVRCLVHAGDGERSAWRGRAEWSATPAPAVRAAALELGAVLLSQPRGADALCAGRCGVRAGLQSSAPANRLRSVRLALRPGMDLLEQVVTLLNDPAVEVR